MKTLSVRLRFLVFGVIAMVAVVSCCNFPFIKDTESYAYVELGHKVRGETPKRTYVEWKNQADFDKALKQVRDHNGKYCLCVVMPGGTPHPYESNNDCSNYHCPPPENIRTVKVTKSKAADDAAAGASAGNDPNMVHKVAATKAEDITKVLSALK